MDINFISLILSLLTLALVIFIFLNSRNKDESKIRRIEMLPATSSTVEPGSKLNRRNLFGKHEDPRKQNFGLG